MAGSPQGTIYLTIEDYLLKVSPEGKLLSRMHMKDNLGIDEQQKLLLQILSGTSDAKHSF